MKDLKWEEKSYAERYAVYEIYRDALYLKEGWEISFEQCDTGWTGCRWDTIKYTFGQA